MGLIKQEVRDYHLQQYPAEEVLLKPFLSGFDVNWARRRRAYNTELSLYFLGPQQFISQMFGFDHEVALIVSGYDSLEARTMQATEALISDDPARGRVDQSIFFLITEDSEGRQWIDSPLSSLNCNL